MTNFRCALCEKVRPVNQGMMVVYDKDTDYMICKIHKQVKK